MNFWGRAMIFWGRETALPCPDGAVLSMVASDWIVRAGDRAIGKCAIGRSGDREMCSLRANSSCNSVNFTRYPKLGHGRNSDTAPCRFPTNWAVVICDCARRNSDTAVPFPYKSGGGDVLCAGDRLFWGSAKKFGHGAWPFPYKSGGGDVIDRAIDYFGVGKRHCRVLFCLHRAIDILG
jgi:hypothetical protein